VEESFLDKANIKSFTFDELKQEMISLGEKPFRA